MYYSLQYLRALAVIAVLVLHSHALIAQPVATVPLLSEFGWVGVRLFFVISGFIVAERIAHSATLSDYLMRRYLRVFPLYALVTLVALAVALTVDLLPFLLARTDSGAPFAASWWGYVLASLFIVPQDAWPLFAVGWSLEFEIVFYAIFGIATFLAGPMAARLVLLALAVLGAFGAFPGSHAAHVFMVYFLAGALARDGYHAWRRGSFAAAWLGVPVATGLWVAHLYGFAAIGETGFVLASSVSFAGLVLIGLSLEARLPRGRVHGMMVGLGDASFAIYLVHWLVFRLAGLALAGLTVGPVAAEFLRWAVVALALVVSLRVHRTVENPLNTWAVSRAGRVRAALSRGAMRGA